MNNLWLVIQVIGKMAPTILLILLGIIALVALGKNTE